MDELITTGSAVKVTGNGEIGGYLVLFSDAGAPDLEGEYFTKDTDFGVDWSEGGKSAVLWHHGMDPCLGKRELTVQKATIGKDDVGVWLTGVLAMRDEFEKAIAELARAGKLGWSSGTAAHLVEYSDDTGSVRRIAKWPLGLDASLTPTPCEPRTKVTTLKSVDYASPFGLLDGMGEDGAKDIDVSDLNNLSFSDHLTALGTVLSDTLARIERVREMRVKVGRRLSRATCDKLTSHKDSLQAVVTGLDDLMREGDVHEDDGEGAKRIRRLALLALRAEAEGLTV